MPPLFAQPAEHCSMMRWSASVFGFSLARPPQREKN
jgi:hypothetical protein